MVADQSRIAPPDRPSGPEGPAVKDRRTVPGTAAGVLAVVWAALAIALDTRVLLILAAVSALVSAVLVLTAPDVPFRYRDRKARQSENERLSEEADLMAARAARFEAEAVAARADLATVMLGAPTDARPVGRSYDAPPSSNRPPDAAAAHDAEVTRTDEDPAPTDRPEDGERPTPPDEAERRRELRAGLTGASPTGSVAEPPSPDDTAGRITDLSSGLFNQLFFDASLDKRVSAARRGLRPLTVAFVEVVDRATGRAVTPQPVAEILVETLREADTVARSADGLFALLLEDTPENGAIWTLERIRRKLTTDLDDVIVRAGVSCYPAYAFTAEQLVAQAREALDDAREWQQDRIEVTTQEPDDA
jgi:diguanylate cyclase (GGDEF)-like protein